MIKILSKGDALCAEVKQMRKGFFSRIGSIILALILTITFMVPAMVTSQPVYAIGDVNAAGSTVPTNAIDSTTNDVAKTDEIRFSDDRIQILFTHDLHSHLDPFNVDGEDAGGFARIKSLIDDKRYEASNEGIATLVVDAGDFSMGTLFQTIFESEAAELTLLGYMGVEATTFGNHEFDYRSIGVANMLNAAVANASADTNLSLPQLVISNIDWELNSSVDNKIVKEALDAYGAKEYAIIEKAGIRIGVFGLVGDDAEACAPESGIDFDNIVDASKEIVAQIEAEGADIIVCLSHSGVWDDPTVSEDELLAQEVPGIDVIISGHTHTKLEEPIVHGTTIICSTHEYGKNLGEIDLVKNEDGTWAIEGYTINPITDSIEEDPYVASLVDEYRDMINEHYLAQFGYEYDTVLAVNNVEFTPFAEFGRVHEEDTLGSIIADSYMYAVKQAEGENYEPIAMTVAPNGTIRDTIPKGEVTVWDVFNISSLGIGPDRIVGYPLVSIYLTGAELKTVAEIDVSVTALMSAAQLYPSGIRWDYNPNRLILNKVTHVELVDEAGNLVPIEDDKLYRVVAGLYSAQMLSSVEGMSYGILSITPKDKDGNPVTDYEQHIVRDQNGNELKEWYALASYIESFPANENGIAEIPNSYGEPEGRKLAHDDSSISAILKAPNNIAKVIYAISAAVVLILVLAVVIVVKIVKKIKRKRK